MTYRGKPRIGITLGDPGGIGPEVALKALRDVKITEVVEPVLVGPRVAIEHYARSLRLTSRLSIVTELSERPGTRTITALDTGHFDLDEIPFGQVHVECGRAALAAIRRAVALAREGSLDAIVTGPIHKKSAQLAGMAGPGHTEFIAHLCGVEEVRLMLIGPRLRVIHVTAHVSLREALDLVTRDRIAQTIALGVQMVRRLGISRPRIAVAGLNPHAGDEGLFGGEEDREIAPAVAAARQEGFSVAGPFGPDSVFHRAARGEFDLVVAMYHDQGHIAAKTLDFSGAVNVTAGLPIIRTSVDHGTAFDLVGRNQADAGSMKLALLLAARLAAGRRRKPS
jgi:4-hydroxythreonine-4-phosphate dehydrogenase